MSDTANSPAGWYDDPRDPRMERFWDGAAWTNSAQPRANVAAAELAVDSSDVTQPAAATPAGVAPAVAVAEPPPWAAEVVLAEAEQFDDVPATPWWRGTQFLSALAIIGVSAIAILFVFVGRGDSTATNTEAPARAAFTESEADGAVEPDDDATNEVTSTTGAPDDEAGVVADDDPDTDAADDPDTGDAEADDAATDDPLTAGAAAAAAADAVAAAGDEADAEDGATAPTTIPQAEPAGGAEEPETPTTTQAPADETVESTTAPATVTVDGVSDGCLTAIAAAVDAGDPPPEAIHPSFVECATQAEWVQAAEATGLAEQIDVDSWVINECVYNGDLYTSPLCVSAISPDSGPRRINCGDGRADIEWAFADDPQTNDEVCANHFQIECPAGIFHNIPIEAMSEEEASAALCA